MITARCFKVEVLTMQENIHDKRSMKRGSNKEYTKIGRVYKNEVSNSIKFQLRSPRSPFPVLET